MVAVNVIMGACMDSLVVDVVEMIVIMCAGMHSLVSCFGVNSSNLQLWKYLYGCYGLGCARNMKMLRANRVGGGVCVILGNPHMGTTIILRHNYRSLFG